MARQIDERRCSRGLSVADDGWWRKWLRCAEPVDKVPLYMAGVRQSGPSENGIGQRRPFLQYGVISASVGSGGEVTVGRGVDTVLGHHFLRRGGQMSLVARRRRDAAGVTR
jgi:hypothetical protein